VKLGTDLHMFLIYGKSKTRRVRALLSHAFFKHKN